MSWERKTEMAKDLKKIYGASTLKEAKKELKKFFKKWSKNYPHVVKSWKTNLRHLQHFSDIH